jgi:hypothetical protein
MSPGRPGRPEFSLLDPLQDRIRRHGTELGCLARGHELGGFVAHPALPWVSWVFRVSSVPIPDPGAASLHCQQRARKRIFAAVDHQIMDFSE